MWILQRLMAEWSEEGAPQEYGPLLAAAAEVKTDALIPVDDEAFQNPQSMQRAINAYCHSHGMTVPQTKAETARVVLQSLAARYAQAVSHLNDMLPQPIRCLHIIGGGSQNQLLNTLTQQALGIPVMAGPVEATGMGNILTQALAKGEVSGVGEMRQIVRDSM